MAKARISTQQVNTPGRYRFSDECISVAFINTGNALAYVAGVPVPAGGSIAYASQQSGVFIGDDVAVSFGAGSLPMLHVTELSL